MNKLPFRFKYSNKFYEELNNKVCSIYEMKGTMLEVEGDDIVKYYNEDSYSRSNTASLGGSCMRYSSCSDYIEFYARNKVKMAILLDNDELLIGRAILWEADCGTKIMDRIYGNDIVVDKFKSYAIKNGYIHKARQSYSDNDEWVGPDGEFSKYYSVTVNNIRKMPYMDTFKYTDDLSGDDMVLNNNSGEYTFSDTDGCRETYRSYEDEDDDYVYCERSGDRMYIHDAAFVESVGNYYSTRFCVWADDIDAWELKENCVYLEYKDEYVTKDESVIFIDNELSAYHEQYVYEDDAYRLSDGTYIHVNEQVDNPFSGKDQVDIGCSMDVRVTLEDESLIIEWIRSGWYESNDDLIEDINDAYDNKVIKVLLNGEEIFSRELING
jgi:hypothetical protein